MHEQEARAAAYQQVIDWVYLLADTKNKKLEDRVAAVYAQVLVAYPPDLVYRAIIACAADADPWVPPVGAIVARIAAHLRTAPGPRGVPAILAPGDAWKLARRAIAGFQPQTRPDPTSGDPAIDAALRAIGGLAACTWEDHIGEGTIRRAFLKAYEEASATAEHVGWALRTGGRRAVFPALELPAPERARLAAGGAALLALAEGGQATRAATPQDYAPDDPRTLALPAPGSVVLTPAARAAAYEQFDAAVAPFVGAARRAKERRLELLGARRREYGA
jgi:hypothetical protein